MRSLHRVGVALLLIGTLASAVQAQPPAPSPAAILARIAALEQEIATLKAQLPVAPPPAVSAPPSLAEASAQAAQVKHDWPRSTSTYFNADLKDGPPVAAPPPLIALPPSGEQARQGDYSRAALKDEMYWKGRMQQLQVQLDADTIHAAAMADRVASLSAAFNGSGSLSQRAVLRREREAAATELTRLRSTVTADRRLIATAEEEARRANVPPGWLRP